MTTHIVDSKAKLDGLLWRRDALQPGDVVEIHGRIETGTGKDGPLVLVAQGTPDNPIVIRGTGEAALVGRSLHVIGRHVSIQDIEVMNAARGVYIAPHAEFPNLTAEHVVIRRVDASRCAESFRVERASHVQISQCVASNGVMAVNDAAHDNDYGAMALHVEHAEDVRFEQNRIIDMQEPSMDYREDGSAGEASKSVRGLYIRDNRIYGAPTLFEAGGWAASGYEMHDVVIEGNVIYSPPENYILSWQRVTIHTPHATGSNFRLKAISGFVIRNNIFINFIDHRQNPPQARTFIPGWGKLTPDELVWENNTDIEREMTEDEFFAAYPFGGETLLPPTVEPTPEPEPQPGQTWKNVTLRLQAEMDDGSLVTMPDALATLLVPETPISTEEQAFLDVFRRLGDADRSMLKSVASRLLA